MSDMIDRDAAIAKVTAHSDGARKKMAAFWEDQDGDNYEAWSSIAGHLDIVADTLRALPAVEVGVAARKGFPILGQRGVYVDWQLVADHGGQANTNHGQTVARLAERGGLSWCELFAVLHNQRWQKMDANKAMIACRALESRYLAALTVTPAPDAGKVQALVEALEYYADPQNWRDTPPWDGDPDCFTAKAIPVQVWDNNACDCGNIARAALASMKEG